ncbi:MAG: hypothetical protein DWQ31_12385 [Planctomycetota bacterium]|nr:MAG: hypothetical protein DWQ31_12385 [Planctomycetota bacterium]REJ93359.1 MAG: hypothetical protein DWQ35_10480 [Planctomycetota bacterium]REK25441.1 MAG: hypothetical protein DWQ42_11030 [Planctomycetota bacterium]REK40855.1 MAG: hypothetical protein DWQ46_15290 [Planctomycetota bacterium]
MKSIDEAVLEVDTVARYRYLAEFIGFDETDAAAIHQLAGYLAPHINRIVERTYEKLLAYDATARHFLPRQHGFDGELPASLAALSADDAQIQFRKEHLSRYLMHLLGHAYNDKMAEYLDMVGKMHTPQAGSREIDVPLVQMNALMGLLSDCLLTQIMELDLDAATKIDAVRSWNKLLWIQNDLIGRHYQADAAGVSSG